IAVLDVVVESTDRGDVFTLSVRRMDREPRGGVGGLFAALQQRGASCAGGEGIAPLRERYSPPRHRACRIRGQYVVEPLDRRAKLERVQQRDRAVELHRDFRTA